MKIFITVIAIMFSVCAQAQQPVLTYTLDPVRLDSFFLIEKVVEAPTKDFPRGKETVTHFLLRDTAQLRQVVAGFTSEVKKGEQAMKQYGEQVPVWKVKSQLIEGLMLQSEWYQKPKITSTNATGAKPKS